MTRIDTSADRAAYRAAARRHNSTIGPLLTAIADAWDAAEATTVSEAEAWRWSPVVKAALDYVDVA